LRFIAHAINDAVPIIAEQQRAILRESDVDRTTPNIFLAGSETDDKILVLASRLAVLERKTDDLVAGYEGHGSRNRARPRRHRPSRRQEIDRPH
jgi:hypothetical protein